MTVEGSLSVGVAVSKPRRIDTVYSESVYKLHGTSCKR